MKHNYLFKSVLSGIMLAAGSIANAQCIHPITYSGGAGGNSSFFGWVGERFEVTYPPSLAGDKTFTTPNLGDGATGTWAGFPGTAPAMPMMLPYDTVITYPSDSCVTAIPITIDMTNKIGMVYRGASVQFGTKALACQNAGATACIIVNNVDGGPVGMAAGTDGGSVTIPVFMISKSDGDAIYAMVRSGVPVTINSFQWGQGNLNDLGLVSGGLSQWHNGAIPAYELTAGGDPMAYRGFDGAFVANFGNSDASNVVLRATTSFTPSGGSATVVHKDSVSLASFPQTDSIWAMYCQQYNLEQYITGNGTINVTYDVYQNGVIDQFPFDNTTSYSVQVTDNIYTKGRWDAANHRPFCTFYTGPGTNSGGTYDNYVWGPSFYVKTSRIADSSTFSLVTATSSGLVWTIPAGSYTNVYLLKWIDGSGSTAADSFMQNEELWLQGVGTYNYNGTTDSSFQYFHVAFTDSNGSNPGTIRLDSNSWYWLGTEMPQTGTTSYAIGCDGINNGYPRLYGRDTFDNYLEYYAPLWSSGSRQTEGSTMLAYPTYFDAIVPFGGTYYVTSLDSVIFPNEKGLIPNVSLSTKMWPTVTNTVKKDMTTLSVYPNPASEIVNVNLGLESTAKQVIYKILSTSGKILSSETHTNVQSEVYSYNTEKLAAGVYYMIVMADGKTMFRKFTVVH